MIPIPDTFQINSRDPRPIYEQYAVHIVYLCDQNRLHEGDRLPPERELAEKLNISRGTLKKAFDLLKKQGYLECKQGSGNYIVLPDKNQNLSPSTLQRVWETCARCFSELQTLDIPNQQIFALMHNYLNEIEYKYAEVNLALAGCSPEILACFEAQLKDLEHLHIKTYIIKDLERSPALLAQAAKCDLIFTGAGHFKQLQALFPQCLDRIYSFAASPTPATMLQIAALPRSARCAVVCQGMRFFQIVRKSLMGIAPVLPDPLFLMTESDSVVPRHIPDVVDALIVASHSPLLDAVSFSPVLKKFIDGGGKIIRYAYEMDQGSCILLERAAHQAYQRKLLGGISNISPVDSQFSKH